jgi:predicted enzyme involved in methoxymalonyl-ACP biosynthesis
MERAVQLLNKTNQFNTNTLRMNVSEIKKYRGAMGHRIYVANVSDKYGDSGLVVILMLHTKDQLQS